MSLNGIFTMAIMRATKVLVITILIFSFQAGILSAQSQPSVIWQTASKRISDHEFSIELTAIIKSGWHIYSQKIPEGGPMPTQVVFESNDDLILVGNTSERGKVQSEYNELYEMEIAWYSDSLVLTQRVKVNQNTTVIKGDVEYMACNNQACVPGRASFQFDLKGKVR